MICKDIRCMLLFECLLLPCEKNSLKLFYLYRFSRAVCVYGAYYYRLQQLFANMMSILRRLDTDELSNTWLKINLCLSRQRNYPKTAIVNLQHIISYLEANNLRKLHYLKIFVNITINYIFTWYICNNSLVET